jgi:hypothetical protein
MQVDDDERVHKKPKTEHESEPTDGETLTVNEFVDGQVKAYNVFLTTLVQIVGRLSKLEQDFYKK